MNEFGGHDWVLRRKRETGVRSIKDLLALSPDHDPFNIGTPAHKERARWFRDVWAKHYKGQTEIHLRRVHYRVFATKGHKPHRVPYENIKADWNYLQLAALYARILFPDDVPADAFEDRRNDQPHDLAWSGDPHFPPKPSIILPSHSWELPSLGVSLSSSDWRIDDPDVIGYEEDDYADRRYLCELWIEKSTMNDVLDPLCAELGVRFVPSIGRQSVTGAVKLCQRVRETGKPARIFYISDYDKAGRGMPTQVARHVEFWRRRYAPRSDAKVIVLALTEAQIEKHHLPKSFDAKGYVVELDALEAFVPGELERIVREAIEPYLDHGMGSRLRQTENAALHVVGKEWSSLIEPHKRRLEALQKRVRSVTKQYQKEADRLNKRLRRDLTPFEKPLARLRAEVTDAGVGMKRDLELPERPAEEIGEPDESDCLFDSSRSYEEQLKFYKVQKRT